MPELGNNQANNYMTTLLLAFIPLVNNLVAYGCHKDRHYRANDIENAVWQICDC